MIAEDNSIYSRKYWHDIQVPMLMDEYNFSESVAEKVFEWHWNEHHAFISDIQNCINEIAEFAYDIIQEVKHECY